MKIVQATVEDIPRIMECARLFTRELPDCTLNEMHYASQWTRFLEEGYGVIFLMVDEADYVAGGIGGICNPDLITGLKEAVELFWYVKPEHRGCMDSVRMLKRFETWASQQGCCHVSMIHMESSMPVKLKQFYGHRGYSLLETVYRKSL